MLFDFIRVKLFEGLSKELLEKKNKNKVEHEKRIFYVTLAEASTKIKEFFPSFFFIVFVIFYMIYVFVL